MTERRHAGRPAAPGLASGPVALVRGVAPARRGSGDPATEAAALRAAVDAARAELEAFAATLDTDAAEVLGFQVAVLEDPTLAEPALEAVARGQPAHEAWTAALDAEVAGYEASDDEHFRARSADLRDVRDRVLAHLSGATLETAVPPGAIVAAVDLPPSRFMAVDWARGGGLALTGGSPTSHVAMLARARGVPAVVGLGVELETLRGPALLDGTQGALILEPSEATRAAFEAERTTRAAAHRAALARARGPARTRDGTRVRVLLNVSDPAELAGIDPETCDGVGLVRTELLFHGASLPEEDAQLAGFAAVVAWARGRPVTLRTLDAGGDKPIPGLTLEGETNPFLGVRGLRLSLLRPDVFRVQLRAVARAAALGPVKVMLPMVTAPRELAQARALLEAEVAALAAAGVPAARPPLGIMVEVPAAAIAADLFDADFLSIGSNDLAQYVAAASRDAGALSDLADPVQPAMLRLIRHVVTVGATRDVEVSLCGDAGADPAAIPALLGAGLRVLSVAPARVAEVKDAIAEVDLARLEVAAAPAAPGQAAGKPSQERSRA